jgi:hypothetical protein
MGKCQMLLTQEAPEIAQSCNKETDHFWEMGEIGKMFICEEHAKGGPASGHTWREVT